MSTKDEDADHGLTPREWLDSDPVPLTPDIDFNDPEQRNAWIRANNEELRARHLELQARRSRGGSRSSDGGASSATAAAGGEAVARTSTTTVVPVRFLNAEQRALVRQARKEGVAVSDLVRRWVRAGMEQLVEPAEPDERREELTAAADAVVARITDEVRRLREIVTAPG